MAKKIEVLTEASSYHIKNSEARELSLSGRAVFVDELRTKMREIPTFLQVRGKLGQWKPVGRKCMGIDGPAFKTLQLV